MPEKNQTFVCLNHGSGGGTLGGTSEVVHNYAAPNLSAIVNALAALTEKIETLKLDVKVDVLEPHVVEITPTIYVPETPVTVNIPPFDVPKIQPVIAVNVTVPVWPILAMGSIPILALITDLIMRYQQ